MNAIATGHPVSATPARASVKHILFATDFSAESGNALSYAAGFARNFGADLLIAHVIDPMTYALSPIDALGTLIAEFRSSAEQRLSALAGSTELREFKPKTWLAEGALWPALSRVIEANKIDLIVLGTHGRTGASKVFLGSSAEAILRNAKIPVLTVGPHVRPPKLFRRILYATDLTPGTHEAARVALGFAEQFGAELILLHVAASAAGIGSGGAATLQGLSRVLRDVVPGDADLTRDPELLVELGSAANKILGVASDKRVDLIVVGARAANPEIASHFAGSTAYSVIRHAAVPVLSVRTEREFRS